VTEQRVQRRLAAILAADVVGYSALMQRAEEATYAEFERLKRAVIEPGLSRHDGRLIKTTGDGALAEFASPSAAVRCAVEIQESIASGRSSLKLMRKAAGKVRITGQLIDAVTGAHIWADRFERDLTDVFALQDEVTVAVVSAIQPKLLQTEIALAARRRPENLTAYDFYLRAMQQYYLATREGNAEAIRLAHRALELDPRFCLVAAVAGVCHMRNVLYGYAVDPQFDRNEAVRLVRLALTIDDSDPDTLAWAALISAFLVHDYEGAIEMADRAVVLNPNTFYAWAGRGHVYRIAGLAEEAVRSFERAIRMSPADPRLHFTFAGMGMAFIELGRFDEAIVVGKKAQRQNPSNSSTYCCLASAFAHLGRDAEARETAARLLEVDPAFTISARMGRRRQSHVKLLIEGLRKAGLPE
jgi:adenylate cyclase